MKFSGWRDNRKYTMCIEFNQVDSILVEDQPEGNTTLYKRESQEVPLNKELFEETIQAICRGNMQLWRIIHKLLCKDSCYGQDLIKEILARQVS